VQGLIDRHDPVATLDRAVGKRQRSSRGRRQREDVAAAPLGGCSPLQSDGLESAAKRFGATPMGVAQFWLLLHSPNVMLIPGTSSVDHLRGNVAGAALPLDAVVELDAV